MTGEYDEALKAEAKLVHISSMPMRLRKVPKHNKKARVSSRKILM
jgi:hypothetical protein